MNSALLDLRPRQVGPLAIPAQRGAASQLTYAELKRATDRFANLLDALGVKRGERVFVLAGRIPELYVAALGTLKHGSVFCPLFSAFGPEPIEQRCGWVRRDCW